MLVLFFRTTISLGSVPFSGLLAGGGGSCLILKGFGFELLNWGNTEEGYGGDLGDDNEELDGETMPPLGLKAEGGYGPNPPEERWLSEFSFKLELTAAADTAALTACAAAACCNRLCCC